MDHTPGLVLPGSYRLPSAAAGYRLTGDGINARCFNRARLQTEKALRVDPAKAHERAIIAARARNSPDTYIRQLERATLTDEQKRRLAALVVRLLIGEQPAAEAQR